jgi:hypothetical protein
MRMTNPHVWSLMALTQLLEIQFLKARGLTHNISLASAVCVMWAGV